MSDPSWPRTATAAPWTLRAATAIVSIETLVETTVVAGRTALTPGLRGLLVACLALKWLFAWRALRLRPGAMMGLLLLEGTTIVAAFGAVEAAGLVRLALGGTALACMVLLSASLHAFPTPALPKG